MRTCTLCARRAGWFDHWLCRGHRHELGAPLVGATVTEAELYTALVFTFPPECARAEFLARVKFVSSFWHFNARARRVMRAFGLLGKAKVSASGVRRGEMLEMLTRFVAFICAHVHVVPQVGAMCAGRVAEWYGSVLVVDSRAAMLRGERMLLLLERATGTRDYLVLADLVCALDARLPRDAIERVYAAYLARCSDSATPLARDLAVFS